MLQKTGGGGGGLFFPPSPTYATAVVSSERAWEKYWSLEILSLDRLPVLLYVVLVMIWVHFVGKPKLMNPAS